MRIKALRVPLMALAGCSTGVGSDPRGEEMKARPKGERTVNEAGDFTKHCIFN